MKEKITLDLVQFHHAMENEKRILTELRDDLILKNHFSAAARILELEQDVKNIQIKICRDLRDVNEQSLNGPL